MGNEMGNNNTSSIKEEDNISEGDKNNLLEDTKDSNVTSQDVHADGVNEKDTSLAKDVMENSSNDFNDISEDDHTDDVKGEIQTILTEEATDAKEQARIFASSNITDILENVSLEGDIDPSDKNMENQMQLQAEAEDFQEKPPGLASEDTITKLGEVLLQEESLGNDVKEEIQMIPIAEAKDIEEKATEVISNNTESMIENDSLERDTHESDVNMENQVLPIAEAEDVEEEAEGIASDHTISSLENELLIGKDDQELASNLSYDDETSELEGKTQEDKQDGDIILPITKGKTTILASDDPLNLRKSFDGEGEEMNGVIQSEKSSYAGSFESESCESLLTSSMESTEDCRMQEDSTDNHDPNDESSIKHDEEETMVLALIAATQSDDSELQEPPSVVKSLCEHSLQGTESLLTDTLLDATCHIQQINDGVLEKDIESKEKLLYANKSDGRDRNEFEKGLIDTSEATSDPSTTNSNNNNNENLLNNVNYTTEDSLNPFPETFAVDSQLKSDQEENPKDYKPDQCMKEIKEKKFDMVNNTYDMTIGSNGNYNVERHTILDSSVFEISNSGQVEEFKVTENGFQVDSRVFEIAKSDQVEEPKVNENGLQLDASVNNSNKASDESSAVPEHKHSVVPEAETVSLIADTNENPESSYAMVNDFEETDMSDHCNSILETINQEEYLSLQNSTSLKQTNDTKYLDLTVEKHDFSKLITVPSIYLVDEEAIEKESENHSQQAEATSAVTCISTEPCSNNSILADSGYETRLSIESNPDIPIISCQIQKSPSFNLDLRIEARKEESDQTPLLYQDKSNNESLSKLSGINISDSMLHNAEMPVEEKIVTMERSYSEIYKAPFTSMLKDEEEAHLLVMAQTQDNHSGTNKEVKEVSSSSHEGKEKRKSRSYFFSSCVCCATVTN